MANAKETGNLIMDIRRHGKSGELGFTTVCLSQWGTGLWQVVITAGFNNFFLIFYLLFIFWLQDVLWLCPNKSGTIPP